MNDILHALRPIAGIVFHSANELQKKYFLSRAAAKVIASQPGYGRGKKMTIATTHSGIRLFVWVDGTWMDASLQDIGTEEE